MLDLYGGRGEQGADTVQQFRSRKRLGKEVAVAAECASAFQRIVRIARDEEHLHIRTQGGQTVRQLRPRDAGHHDIGDQQVDRFAVLTRDDLGFLAVASFQ